MIFFFVFLLKLIISILVDNITISLKVERTLFLLYRWLLFLFLLLPSSSFLELLLLLLLLPLLLLLLDEGPGCMRSDCWSAAGCCCGKGIMCGCIHICWGIPNGIMLRG